MDINKNYYKIINLTKECNKLEIKKRYYSLVKDIHPDHGGNALDFNLITEAYKILSDDDKRKEYDLKSKWGKNYDELSELLDYDFNDSNKMWNEDKYNDFKKKESLNIVHRVSDDFNGTIKYERWIICKKCKGSGKDIYSKIEIKNKEGKVVKIFEGEDGCDYCEGTGKDFRGLDCQFCFGHGKSGSKDCDVCKGEKRILGNQKLNVSFNEGQTEIKIDFMGNFSKDVPGKVGHLWVLKSKK